jgi:hypothetical protein
MTSDFDDCASITNGDGDDRARARNSLRCFRPAAEQNTGLTPRMNWFVVTDRVGMPWVAEEGC